MFNRCVLLSELRRTRTNCFFSFVPNRKSQLLFYSYFFFCFAFCAPLIQTTNSLRAFYYKCLTWSIWLIVKAELLVARRALYMSDVMSLLAMEWVHGLAYCVLHLQAINMRTTVFIFFLYFCLSNLLRNLCIYLHCTQRIRTWIIHTLVKINACGKSGWMELMCNKAFFQFKDITTNLAEWILFVVVEHRRTFVYFIFPSLKIKKKMGDTL